MEFGIQVIEGDGHRFRHAIGLGDGNPGPLLPLLYDLHGHRGARRKTVAQTVRSAPRVGQGEEADIDGRHGKEFRYPAGLQDFEYPVDVEGGSNCRRPELRMVEFMMWSWPKT